MNTTDTGLEAISRLDPRVEVRLSPLHGRGLFATGFIAEGEAVVRWDGEVLPIAELESLKARPTYSCAALSLDSILVFRDNDPVNFGNHSCDPNLWMSDEVTECARRNIKPDEELTVDYAVHSDDPAWQMPCMCGSPACRRIIRGDDWQVPELQRRYAGHFSPYLNERIRR
jgi:SET domain-containing protein